jgi:hypothetical protein
LVSMRIRIQQFDMDSGFAITMTVNLPVKLLYRPTYLVQKIFSLV